MKEAVVRGPVKRVVLALCLGLGGVAAGWASGVIPSSQAHVVGGQYSMELTTAATTVPLGGTFTLNAGVVHDGSVGAYTAVQWSVAYDNTIVQFASAEIDAQAPAECSAHSDNGTRTLVGCISLGGPTITFSGIAWDITYTCIAPGVATFAFAGVNSFTWVKVGTETQPIHTHDGAGVTCGGDAAGPTVGPMAAPTGTVGANATPGAQPTSTAPNGGATSIVPAATESSTSTVQRTATNAAGTSSATSATSAAPAGAGSATASPTPAAPSGTDTGGGGHRLLYVLGGIGLAAVAAIGAGAWWMRRKQT